MKYHHFEILQREDGELWILGQGAGGRTYKARDTQLARLVALKVVTAEAFRTPEAKERFVAEARTAASLHHPNIASIYYFGEQDGDCFYAMELVDGCTLEELVEREGALPAAAALDVVSQVAGALGVAHEADLIHRDVKPANILITESSPGKRNAKLIDFGLAAGANAAADGKAVFAGTPLFASPEQLDEADVDARSDIYSLGAVLFFLLSGRPPYTGTLSQIVTQHTLQPTPVDLISAAPAEVIALVKRYMKKSPDQRPRSGAQAKAEAEAALRALRPDNQATALEWLTNHYKAVGRLRQVEGGFLYRLTEKESGEQAEALHLDQSAAGLQAADQYRFAVPKIAKLGSPCFRQPGTLVEVADGLLIIKKVPAPSTRLLSVMRVRRMLPLGEVRLILEPLAQSLDEAAAAGLAIPQLGLRDIGLFPAQEPQTRLNLWPGLNPRVDILPVAEATDINISATIVGTSLVTAGRVISGEGASPSFILASLAYEMLGGMTAPSSGHYVPLAELGEAQNGALRLALSATGASSLSATELVSDILYPRESREAAWSSEDVRKPPARISSRPGASLPLSSHQETTVKKPSGPEAGHSSRAGSLTASPASLGSSRGKLSAQVSTRGNNSPVDKSTNSSARAFDKTLAVIVAAIVAVVGATVFAVYGVWQDPRTRATVAPPPTSRSTSQVATGLGSGVSGETGPAATFSMDAQQISGTESYSLKVPPGTSRAEANSPAAGDAAASGESVENRTAGLRDKTGLYPGASLGLVDRELRDGGTPTMPIKDLQLVIKARPGVVIDPNNVRINVTFYETLNGRIVPTMSRVQSVWLAAPVDWKGEGIEALEVKYEIPRIGNGGAPPPRFYGYMVNIYYRGRLQETVAQPADLSDMFPPPLNDSSFAGSQPKTKPPAQPAPKTSTRSRATKPSIPRYVAVDAPNAPPGSSLVMIYDTKEKRIVGNEVYKMRTAPKPGSTHRFGTKEAQYLGR